MAVTEVTEVTEDGTDLVAMEVIIKALGMGGEVTVVAAPTGDGTAGVIPGRCMRPLSLIPHAKSMPIVIMEPVETPVFVSTKFKNTLFYTVLLFEIYVYVPSSACSNGVTTLAGRSAGVWGVRAGKFASTSIGLILRPNCFCVLS